MHLVYTQHSCKGRRRAWLMSWWSSVQRCCGQLSYRQDRSTSPQLTSPPMWSALSDLSSALSDCDPAVSAVTVGGRYICRSITNSPDVWSNVNRPHTTFSLLTHFYNMCTNISPISPANDKFTACHVQLQINDQPPSQGAPKQMKWLSTILEERQQLPCIFMFLFSETTTADDRNSKINAKMLC